MLTQPVVIISLFCLILPYDTSNATIYNANNYWSYQNTAASSTQRDSIRPQRMPAWAILYKQLEERRNQYLRNGYNRNLVYPSPQISSASRLKPRTRTRQPQPLLNHGLLMKYFYKHRSSTANSDATAGVVAAPPKSQYTVPVQANPKQQYLPVYPRASPSAPYYPTLGQLFRQSIYPDIVQRRRKKLLQTFVGTTALKEKENSRFVDSFITSTKKNNITPYGILNNANQQQRSPYMPYVYATYQYRNQMAFPGTSQYNIPSQRTAIQNKLFTSSLPPQQLIQRTTNQNIAPQKTLQQPIYTVKQYAAPVSNVQPNVPTTNNVSVSPTVYPKAGSSNFVEKQLQPTNQTSVKPKPEEWDKKDFIPRILQEQTQPAIHLQSKIYKQSKKDVIPEMNNFTSTMANVTNTTLSSFYHKQQIRDKFLKQKDTIKEVSNSTKREFLPHPTNLITSFSTNHSTATNSDNPSWRRTVNHNHIFHPIIAAILPKDGSEFPSNRQQLLHTVNASKREFLPFDSHDKETDDDSDGDDFIENDNNEGQENSLKKGFTGDNEEDRDNSENLDDVNEDEGGNVDKEIEQRIQQIASGGAKPSDFNGISKFPLGPEDEEAGEEEQSSLMGKTPTKDMSDTIHQGMVHNIATSRENVDKTPLQSSSQQKKHSELANDEEAEAAKEDQEAKKMMTSKDKFRMDDEPEILDLNGKGISSTTDKASISASFANSLTQNVNQDSRVGIDTTDPFVTQSFDKGHQSTPFDEDINKVQPFHKNNKYDDTATDIPLNYGKERFEESENEYHKSSPEFVNGHVKSHSPSLEPELLDSTENDETKKPSTENFELADKHFQHIMDMHQDENNIAGNLDPMELENKDDEEKAALLDPEKAQERTIALSTERELQEHLSKTKDTDSKHSSTGSSSGRREYSKTSSEDKKEDDLSAEEALHALNGAALPSKEKENVGREDSNTHKESALNSITSPSKGPLRNPADVESAVQKEEDGKKKADTGDKKSNAKNVEEPKKETSDVANTSVSKEVVDLLKSLGQIKTLSQSPSSEKQNAPSSSNSASMESGKATIDSEEKETKEAVHDLGIAIGILEQKLSLINQAKATGDKKNTFIVDNSSKNKESKGAAKSTIELGSSVRLLEKVMNVAERFRKKSDLKKQGSKRNIIATKSPLISKKLYDPKPTRRSFYQQSREKGIINKTPSPLFSRDYYSSKPIRNSFYQLQRKLYPTPFSSSWKKTDIRQRYSNEYFEPYQQQYFTPWYNGNELDYQW